MPRRAWLPTLVVVSDGKPTDDWERPLQRLQTSPTVAGRFGLPLASAKTATSLSFASSIQNPEVPVVRRGGRAVAASSASSAIPSAAPFRPLATLTSPRCRGTCSRTTKTGDLAPENDNAPRPLCREQVTWFAIAKGVVTALENCSGKERKGLSTRWLNDPEVVVKVRPAPPPDQDQLLRQRLRVLALRHLRRGNDHQTAGCARLTSSRLRDATAGDDRYAGRPGSSRKRGGSHGSRRPAGCGAASDWGQAWPKHWSIFTAKGCVMSICPPITSSWSAKGRRVRFA